MLTGAPSASLNAVSVEICPASGYQATGLLAVASSNPVSDHKGAHTIGVCTKGSVSYWNADFSSRTPTNGDTCIKCDDASLTAKNTYAPRDGMTACLPCKGGTKPAASGSTGPDSCVACDAGDYRSFYTNKCVALHCPDQPCLRRDGALPICCFGRAPLTPATPPCCRASCDPCTAGSEVGPSSRQACTQWCVDGWGRVRLRLSQRRLSVGGTFLSLNKSAPCNHLPPLCSRPGTYMDSDMVTANADFCAQCPVRPAARIGWHN